MFKKRITILLIISRIHQLHPTCSYKPQLVIIIRTNLLRKKKHILVNPMNKLHTKVNTKYSIINMLVSIINLAFRITHKYIFVHATVYGAIQLACTLKKVHFFFF